MTQTPPAATGNPAIDGPPLRVRADLSRVGEGTTATVVVEAATDDPHVARTWLGDHKRASDEATAYAGKLGLYGAAVSDVRGPYGVNAAGQPCTQATNGDAKAATFRIDFTLQGR